MIFRKRRKVQIERSDDLSDYRKHLQTAEQKSQEDFDKTVLSLSGGALGISFVFLRDVIGPNPVVEPNLLFTAWVAWGMSTFCVLASYYSSQLTLRKAISQVDAKTIRNEKAGGAYRLITAFLNAAGACLFLVGVIAIVLFGNSNLKSKERFSANFKASGTAASASSAASAP